MKSADRQGDIDQQLVIGMPCLCSQSWAAAQEARSVLRTMGLPPEVTAVKTGTPLAPPVAALKMGAALQPAARLAWGPAERSAHQPETPVLAVLWMPAAPAELRTPLEMLFRWMAAQVPFKMGPHPRARSTLHPMAGVT